MRAGLNNHLVCNKEKAELKNKCNELAKNNENMIKRIKEYKRDLDISNTKISSYEKEIIQVKLEYNKLVDKYRNVLFNYRQC